MPETTAFERRSALGGSIPDSPGDGIVASLHASLALVTMRARKGQAAALAQRVRDGFGIELPDGPRRHEHDGVAFCGIAPEAWLATCEAGGYEFAFSLSQVTEGCASACDQTDAYTVLRLNGPKVIDVLAKLVPIDLDPATFRSGDIATTAACYMSVIVWRPVETADVTAAFTLAVPRSLTQTFCRLLVYHAAGVGFRFE